MRLQDITKEYRIANGIVASLLVLLLLLPFAGIVSERLGHPLFASNTFNCFVKEHTGQPCPTCGLSHSVLSLYQGKFTQSLEQNKWGFLFVALLLTQLCLRVVPIAKRQIWIPYFDIAQVLVCCLIFRFLVSRG